MTRIKDALDAVAAAIIAQKDYLCNLDAKTGYGDHGLNMARGFTAEFVLIGQTAVEVPFLPLHGITAANTEDIAVHRVEVIMVAGRIKVYTIAAVEEILAIDIHRPAFANSDFPAYAKMEAPVAGTGIVARRIPRRIPQDIAGIVFDIAATEAAFYIEARGCLPLRQHTAARIVHGTVAALGAIMRGIIAASILRRSAYVLFLYGYCNKKFSVNT